MKSCKIAEFINLKLVGDNSEIKKARSMSAVEENSITYAGKLDENFINKVNGLSEVFVVADKVYKDRITCAHVISNNPRLDFIKIVREFFSDKGSGPVIHKSAVVEVGAKIGKGVSLGVNCFVGKDVEIGNDTKIHNNVVLVGKVSVGQKCVIKSGAVIGEEGFGFEYDENNEPLHFPHVGDVLIGDNVFIGSNTTIERATMDSTIICNNVKIDDLVQIGHNSFISDNTMIMAGAVICGGAFIGKNCWVAPNVSVKQKLKVGNNAYIGLGSVVIKDVAPNTTVAGVPAKELKK